MMPRSLGVWRKGSDTAGFRGQAWEHSSDSKDFESSTVKPHESLVSAAGH